MPIQVTCPGCLTRFRVSDKFAGQTGPCPKCKGQIRIPAKSDEVIIHAPEQFGPKNAEGKAVLKPIERAETKITPVAIVAMVGSVLLVLVVAFLLGRAYADSGVPWVILVVGAVLIAPPAALGGYSFLRDDDLEPYRGASLVLRLTICSAVYAALWGVYAYFSSLLLGQRSPEIWQLVFAVPALVSIGAVAPFAALDLDYTNSCLHYGVYLLATVLLRLLMGLPPF